MYIFGTMSVDTYDVIYSSAKAICPVTWKLTFASEKSFAMLALFGIIVCTKQMFVANIVFMETPKISFVGFISTSTFLVTKL